MKALLLEGKERLVYADVDEPETVGDRPVLVRVAAVVEEAPPESRFHSGDRVAVCPLIPNLRDPLARIGEHAVSSGYDYFGSRRHGAFAAPDV